MPDSNKAYKVITNGFVFSFSNDEINAVDIVKTSPAEFNLIKNNRSVNAKIVEVGAGGKKLRIEIESETFDMEIKDELDQVLETMGYNSATGKQIKEIRAPMPGLVLEIDVLAGQEVNEGDKILILEAMKMENSITAHSNARIKRVVVVKGQAVEKGQVLVELE